MTSIRIDKLTRHFRASPPVAALDGVDLEIRPGELVSILGPSGCGKTTLLRSIAGLERPDGGKITIGDTVVDHDGVHVSPARRRVGLVPQEGALFPHLDVAGNIGFGLRSLKRADRARRVDELLEIVDLPDLGHRRPHELSGGQQQRVALARALAPEPSAVLLDEPFSALDTGLRSAVRAEVATLLRDRGTTTVLVTHDQVEAMTMADTMAVMRHGRIVQVGTPQDVYSRPCDLWVGSFLGEAVVVTGERVEDHLARGPFGTVELAADFAHHHGPDVSLFIRPEQVQPAPAGAEDAVAVTVESIQYLGSELLVDLLTSQGDSVRARWPSTVTVRADDALQVGVVGPVLALASDGSSGGVETETGRGR